MRAQTTLDFAIGMSIFLLTVAFVVSFLPGMFQPFDASGGSETVTADRVADQFGRRLVAAGAEPYVLDVSCTEQFFGGSAAGCRFTGSTFRDRLGVADDANLNLQLVGDVDGDGQSKALCTDDDGPIEEAPCPAGTTRLEAGSTPPDDTNSVVVARRVVSIQNRDATVLVRMW